MKILDRTIQVNSEPQIFGAVASFKTTLEKIKETDDFAIYKLSLKSKKSAALTPISVQWRFPAHDIKGVWTTNALHEKRIRADWEHPSIVSRLSVGAPILCLFGHEDDNILTIACKDVVNTIELEAPVREENSFIYCQLRFFTEKMPLTKEYETEIRIEKSLVHFSEAIRNISNWWASFPALTPIATPPAAMLPLYSTWYAYHQSITAEGLLAECKAAARLGYKVLVVDDGWQTLDSGRGYDYTGDWEPDRIPDMAGFVESVHQLGMKCMIWYSVPFCGVKSKAYQQFKGKFLTEGHPWAPVFDPRYPEVRAYLVSKYASALLDWKLDGFKLDFIDDFKAYPETELTKANGRDFASVNEGVHQLLIDIRSALEQINPAVLIEFRQKYIGPGLRPFGNMFRAFDCPNDSVGNRMRTTDVKLLCGTTAVHSDMLTWHYDEPVEIAALQLVNVLFSVPQLSVRMAEISSDHKQMITFYTRYWLENRAILLDGEFIPYSPLSNYPILSAYLDNKIIFGVYENAVVEIDPDFDQIDIINGKLHEQVAFECMGSLGTCQVRIFDCQGNLDWESKENFEEGIHALEVPASGLIQLEKIKGLKVLR